MREKLLYIGILIPILVLVFYIHSNKIEPFESFSLRFNDTNFNLQQKEPSKDVVFVAVDEPSVNEYGRWPWKRSKLALGIDNLYEADVVLMDMIFSEETTHNEDMLLGESLANLNASVCGFFLRPKATQHITDEELDILGDSSLDLLQSQIAQSTNPKFMHAPYAEMNILPIMQSCTLNGSFTTLISSDNLMRSYPIASYFQNILYPSLAIAGLRIKLNKDIKRVDALHVEIDDKNIPLDERGFIRANFYKLEQYNTVSFLDVASKKIKPEYFKGKIVILGITEVGAGDVVSTPIGSIPGPLLHYTFLSNYLENHLIVELKNITPALIVMMLLLPFIMVLIVKKIVYRTILNISIYILVFAIVKYLFVVHMIYIDLFYPLLTLILSLVAVEAIAFNMQEKSDKFLRETFSSYLSADLLKKLIANPESLKLGGQRKELSILFSDIRGFTTLSESMSPEDLIQVLNRYLTPMAYSVIENGGMLDKYIGDAVMAFFNAPVDVKKHADASCLCALSMIEKLDSLNEELKAEGVQQIQIGIGINTAEVVVGNIGSESKKEYTIIGDGVNLASRVESLTKRYDSNILLTQFTIDKLDGEFIYREIEPVQVKGKTEGILFYELMPNNETSKKVKKLYDEALKVYKNDDFKEAQTLFKELIDKYDDNLAKYFLPTVEEGHSWGINKMTTK